MDLPLYPTTPHLEGSLGRRLVDGGLPRAALDGWTLVVEEKLEGDAIGLLFDADAELRLLNHGAVIDRATSGWRFAPAFIWADQHLDILFELLGERYVLYGECLAWAHTVYYDALPDTVVEYDVYDRTHGVFLTTPQRRRLLAGSGVVHAPVLHEGPAPDDLETLIGPAAYKSAGWPAHLSQALRCAGIDPARAGVEMSGLMEGLYLKVEEDGRVGARAKLIRTGFHAALVAAGRHWRERRLPNRRADGLDMRA